MPSTDIKEYGIFTLQRLDRGTWGVDAGLRFDTRTLETPTQKRDFDNVSASLGVFLKPTDSLFYALTLSRNGRAPTEFELFANGPHPGTGGFEVGDDSLDNETVTSLEATVRWKGDRLRAEGHLWAATYDSFIEEAPTGAVEEDLPVYQYFQTKADFHGAESRGQLRGLARCVPVDPPGDHLRLGARRHRRRRARPHPAVGAGLAAWSGPRRASRPRWRCAASPNRTAWPRSNCPPTATRWSI